MDRRTLIKAGLGTAAALTTAAGCSGGGGGDDDKRPAPTRRGAAPSARDWPALAASLAGRLVRPGDADYSAARQLYNTRYDGLRPAAVAYVSGTHDVRECLAFARRTATPVAIRNGGHSYAGWSSGDGKLIIDVSSLDRIEGGGATATIGAGARLIDVYETLAQGGRTVPGGSCPTVGISGLTLGGGHGTVSRAYGLTCDNLIEATLVTADGKTLTCSKSAHRELFWALRGAGNGSFGVVTRLRFRTHAAPQVATAQMSWPWAKAPAVLRSWQRWGPDQPDEIWSACHLGANHGAEPTVSVTALSLGSYGGLKNAVDRLADQPGGPGPAGSVSVLPMSYLKAVRISAGCTDATTQQCHLQGSVPGRNRDGVLQREAFAARSDFFDEPLDDAAVRALLDHTARAAHAGPGVDGAVILTALGGAVNRVGRDATAFVHRSSRVLAQYYAGWQPGGSPKPGEAWLDGVHGAMRHAASGQAYQNYVDPGLKDWRKAYYGSAAGRLAKLKERYDPGRLFSFPQAI